jgi:hypothetical protein
MELGTHLPSGHQVPSWFRIVRWKIRLDCLEALHGPSELSRFLMIANVFITYCHLLAELEIWSEKDRFIIEASKNEPAGVVRTVHSQPHPLGLATLLILDLELDVVARREFHIEIDSAMILRRGIEKSWRFFHDPSPRPPREEMAWRTKDEKSGVYSHTDSRCFVWSGI